MRADLLRVPPLQIQPAALSLPTPTNSTLLGWDAHPATPPTAEPMSPFLIDPHGGHLVRGILPRPFSRPVVGTFRCAIRLLLPPAVWRP